MSPPRLGKKLGYLERRWRTSLCRHQKAVQSFARLAELHPEEFLADLADSLHEQGVALCNLGRHAEALDSLRRSAELNRRAATADPAAVGALAASLCSLGTLLDALGQLDESGAVRRELQQVRSPRALR